MKKFIVLLMAISLLALAVPALAGYGDYDGDKRCDVHFDVNVDKTVDIDKDVNIDKDFNFCVFANIEPKALAECDVFKCDYNANNKVELKVGTVY